MKKLLVSFAILLIGIAASARTEQDTVSQAARKWYAGLNAGVQVYSGMTDKYLPFKETLAPVGGASFGRYLNDWLSIDLNLAAAQFKGLYTRPAGEKHFTTDDCFDLNAQRYYQKGAYIHCYARAGIDLNTLIAGYKEDRKTAFVPYVGGGVATGLGKTFTDAENFAFAPTIDYGLEFLIRFCPDITGIIDIHNSAVGLQLDNEGCTEHAFHASFGAEFGVRFNLGK